MIIYSYWEGQNYFIAINMVFLRITHFIWILLFNQWVFYSVFDTTSWSESCKERMDYGSVWLELLIGPCRYMPLAATFKFTIKMCLCSNHRVSPIQRIGWFVWREFFLWSDPVVSYMIWTGSVRSKCIGIIQIMLYLLHFPNSIEMYSFPLHWLDLCMILSEWNRGSKEEQRLNYISNK